jgi:hypothetical protein
MAVRRTEEDGMVMAWDEGLFEGSFGTNWDFIWDFRGGK